ncbi:MAG: universal stress protein [Actinobacteria bacterium]|nr:universal stress protein [Actinomycetota bacterium]
MTGGRAILVGYDDGHPARAALRWAAEEAQLRSVGLIVAYVSSPGWELELAALQINPDPIRRDLEQQLRGSWIEAVRMLDVPCETRFVYGQPGPVLVELADAEDVACIAVGVNRHTRLHERVLGSVGIYLVHHAGCPVVQVPAGAPHDGVGLTYRNREAHRSRSR